MRNRDIRQRTSFLRKGFLWIGYASTLWLFLWPSRLCQPHYLAIYALEWLYGPSAGRWAIPALEPPENLRLMEEEEHSRSAWPETKRRLAGPVLGRSRLKFPASRINSNARDAWSSQIYLGPDSGEWAPEEQEIPMTEMPELDSLFEDPAMVDPPTPIEKLSIAYLVMVHSPETVDGGIDLIDTLNDPTNVYFIHIDAKCEHWAYEKFRRHYATTPNVHFSPTRFTLYWGAPDIASAEWELLKMAVEYNLERFPGYWAQYGQDGAKPRPWNTPSDDDLDTPNVNGLAPDGLHAAPWKFVMLLGGKSFPVKHKSYIRGRLARLPSFSNFVLGPPPKLVKACSYRATIVWQDSREPCFRISGRCMDPACTRQTINPYNGVVSKGHQWVMLSWYFAWYLHQNDAPDRYFRLWKAEIVRFFTPDELTFSTLLDNSPYKRTSLLMGARNGHVEPSRIIGTIFIDWGVPCKSHPEWTNPSSPCQLGVQDFTDLVHSNYLFARKIDVDEPLRDLLRQVDQGPLLEISYTQYLLLYVIAVCTIAFVAFMVITCIIPCGWHINQSVTGDVQSEADVRNGAYEMHNVYHDDHTFKSLDRVN